MKTTNSTTNDYYLHLLTSSLESGRSTTDGMSTASAMVAATGNSLQMYDTSCSYQTALDLKRMSSGGGMTGVTGSMSSSVGTYERMYSTFI